MFLFLKTFDPHNVHNMLDPHFKYLSIIENYVGHGATICFAYEYDAKVVIPLLMTCFDQLNLISQACATVIDLLNS